MPIALILLVLNKMTKCSLFFFFKVNYPMITYKGTPTKYEIHKSHANTALGLALDLTSDVYKLCWLG